MRAKGRGKEGERRECWKEARGREARGEFTLTLPIIKVDVRICSMSHQDCEVVVAEVSSRQPMSF